jgi:hypothetical protein
METMWMRLWTETGMEWNRRNDVHSREIEIEIWDQISVEIRQGAGREEEIIQKQT